MTCKVTQLDRESFMSGGFLRGFPYTAASNHYLFHPHLQDLTGVRANESLTELQLFPLQLPLIVDRDKWQEIIRIGPVVQGVQICGRI